MKRNFLCVKKALAIVLTVTMLIMAISCAIMVNASGTMDWSKWENVVPSENDSTVTLGSNTWMTYKEPIADGTYVLNTVYEIESAKIAGAKTYRLAIKLEKTAAGFNYATLRVSTTGVLQTPVFYNQDGETLSDEYNVTKSGSIDSTGAFKVSISYDVDAKKITIEFTDNVGGSAVAAITANSAETDFVNNTIVPEISSTNDVIFSKATVTTSVPTVDIWSNIDSEGNATVGEPITYYLNGVEDAQYVKSVEWTVKSHSLKSNNSSIMTVYYDGIDSENYITYRFNDPGKLYMKKVGSDSITCASVAVSSSRFGAFGDAEISKAGAAFKIKLEYLTSNTATLTFTNGSNPENITKFDISTNRVIDFLSDTHQFAIKVGNTAVFDMDNQPVVEMVSLNTETLLETQAEFIADITQNKTIDRNLDEYKVFLSEYEQLSAFDIATLEEKDVWNNFVAAAKIAFADGIDDDFEDKFYTDMKWSILEQKKTGDYLSDHYSTSTYGEENSNTGIHPITGTASDFVLITAKPNFEKVKYVTFDIIPLDKSVAFTVYPFYADNSTEDIRYAMGLNYTISEGSLWVAKFWPHSANDKGSSGIEGHSAPAIVNVQNGYTSFNIDKSNLSKYMNIGIGKAFKVIAKYEFGENNILSITQTILDNSGNKVAAGTGMVQLAEGYSLQNSYFAIRQSSGGNKVIFDNIKTYSSSEAMDFNVNYANQLAYEADVLTPVQAADVEAMATDYAAVTDKANVNANYSALVTAASKWNKNDIAGSFLNIYAEALQDGGNAEQVQNAWRVLNALDASAKSQLITARQNLKEKLSSDSVANDTIKVSFVGDSQTAQAADRGENYSDFLMNKIKANDTTNTYEYIRLGVPGIKLTSEIPGVSSHEKASIQWHYNKSYSPDIIFLLIGTNDGIKNVTGENFTATLKRTVQLWQSLPTAPTVVLVSPYSNGYNNESLLINQTLANNLPNVQASMKQVQAETGCAFVDLYEYTNNCTSSEKELMFKKDLTDAGGEEKLGISDGLHPGSVGRNLAAEYIYNTFFAKTTVEFATDAIRSYDHSYADNYENYLGYSYYDLDDSVKATVKDKFNADQKVELIEASVPRFGLKATGLDIKSFDGANGQLVYHVKYDTSALEAFGKEFTYGVIAAPEKALADKTALTHTSEILEQYNTITILDIKGTGTPSKNLYFRLLGSESEGFRGFKIAARAYVCIDGEYFYSDNTVAQAVNGERRALANKMIDLSYKGYTKNGLSYVDANGEAYFTGFAEVPTENTIADLLKYVIAADKTSYADTEKVYAFLKDNYDAYIAR